MIRNERGESQEQRDKACSRGGGERGENEDGKTVFHSEINGIEEEEARC